MVSKVHLLSEQALQIILMLRFPSGISSLEADYNSAIIGGSNSTVPKYEWTARDIHNHEAVCGSSARLAMLDADPKVLAR